MSYHISKIIESREIADGPASLRDVENLRNEIDSISPDFYELELAEVKSCMLDEKDLPSRPNPNNTEQRVPDWLYYGCVKVKLATSSKAGVNSLAFPLDTNIKDYPLPG